MWSISVVAVGVVQPCRASVGGSERSTLPTGSGAASALVNLDRSFSLI